MGSMWRIAVLLAACAYSYCPFTSPCRPNEAILSGMVQALAFVGCVPREVWWDNPTAVVSAIFKGPNRSNVLSATCAAQIGIAAISVGGVGRTRSRTMVSAVLIARGRSATSRFQEIHCAVVSNSSRGDCGTRQRGPRGCSLVDAQVPRIRHDLACPAETDEVPLN